MFVANFLDKDLTVPLCKREAITILTQAEEVLGVLRSPDDKKEINKQIIKNSKKVFSACYRCTGQVHHKNPEAYAGKTPGTVSARFKKWARSSRQAVNPEKLQRDLDRCVTTALDRIDKAKKKQKPE